MTWMSKRTSRWIAPLIAAVLAAVILVPVASAAPQPSQRALAQARALAAEWGRCPTARPANALLRQAERARATRPRVALARKAVGAYERVASECIMPVDMPSIVIPPREGPTPPPPSG